MNSEPFLLIGSTQVIGSKASMENMKTIKRSESEQRKLSFSEKFFNIITNINYLCFIAIVCILVIASVFTAIQPTKIGVVTARITKIQSSSMEAFVTSIIDKSGGLQYEDVKGVVNVTSGLCIDKQANYCIPDADVELTLYRNIFGSQWSMTAVI